MERGYTPPPPLIGRGVEVGYDVILYLTTLLGPLVSMIILRFTAVMFCLIYRATKQLHQKSIHQTG